MKLKNRMGINGKTNGNIRKYENKGNGKRNSMKW